MKQLNVYVVVHISRCSPARLRCRGGRDHEIWFSIPDQVSGQRSILFIVKETTVLSCKGAKHEELQRLINYLIHHQLF